MVLERSYSEYDLLPFEMGFLPEAFQKKAEYELKETAENKEIGLKLIRELILKHKIVMFDEDFLLQYLRCRKYDVPRAFTQLRNFVHLKKKNRDAFTNIKFENIQVTTREKIATFLPYRCGDGCAILLVQLDNWKPEEFPLEEVKRMIMLMLLQALRDPMTQVNGFKVIFNVKSNPLKHLRYITPHNLYLLYHSTQQCVPGRFKGIHIVNNSFTFKAAWILLKPFLSEKFKQRFLFHTSEDTLLRFFPAGALPVEYGGEIGDYDMTEWLRRVTGPDFMSNFAGEKQNSNSSEESEEKTDSSDTVNKDSSDTISIDSSDTVNKDSSDTVSYDSSDTANNDSSDTVSNDSSDTVNKD